MSIDPKQLCSSHSADECFTCIAHSTDGSFLGPDIPQYGLSSRSRSLGVGGGGGFSSDLILEQQSIYCNYQANRVTSLHSLKSR